MSKWALAWSYVPIDYGSEIGVLEDMTQRSVIRNNLCGQRIRVKFCNLYHPDPLVIEKAMIATRNRCTGTMSKRKELQCNGKSQIIIGAGEAFYSDVLSCPVSAEDDFELSFYYKERISMRTICITWAAQTWQSRYGCGDQTEADVFEEINLKEISPYLGGDVYSCQFLTGFCNIAVETAEDVQTLAVFGDSITHMSYYSDPLTTALYEKYPGRITVINGGIGGNRLLADEVHAPGIPGEGRLFGKAGVSRFEHDLYGDTTPDIVFFMEGVNDCTHSFAFGEPVPPNGQKLWEGIQRVIALGHQRGSRICISTVMPFGSYQEPWREQAEIIRQDLNALLRAQNDADDFIDLDAQMRKEDDIHVMQDGMHLGDGVHPNAAGGKKIAETILKYFEKKY